MRKLMMVALIMVTGWMAQAQPKVTSAYNANKEGKYEDAKQYIDEALTDPKATEKEKYWRYRGDIYSNLALNSSNENESIKLLNESITSYQKCIDKVTDYKDEIASMIFKDFGYCEKKYIELYDKKNYCEAKEFTLLSISLIDLNDKLKSKSEMSQLVSGGRKSVEENSQTFQNLCISQRINNLVDENKHSEALELINSEKTKAPNNVDLLSYESDIYLSLGQYENASKSLESLVKTSPTNPVFHYFLGNLYQKIDEAPNDAVSFLRSINKGDSELFLDSMATKFEVKLIKENAQYSYQSGDKNFVITTLNNKITDIKSQNLQFPIFSDRATAEYNIALSYDSVHYDANYNLGAQFYNKAQEKSIACNLIPPRETANFDACKAEMKKLYLESAKHFLVCYSKDQNDDAIKRILKETYLKGGDREKSNQYK